MQDLFACRDCHAIYAITRVRQAPISPPFCQNCSCKFPPSELGDWLVYERAEPEWAVDAWLREDLETSENVRRAEDLSHTTDHAIGDLRANSTQIAAESTVPSTRLQKLAPFVVRI
jgi:hypothetical protein